MDRPDPSRQHPAPQSAPGTLDENEVSEHGLEYADILLIRDRLAMTPTERLRAAQAFLNAANRIRAAND